MLPFAISILSLQIEKNCYWSYFFTSIVPATSFQIKPHSHKLVSTHYNAYIVRKYVLLQYAEIILDSWYSKPVTPLLLANNFRWYSLCLSQRRESMITWFRVSNMLIVFLFVLTQIWHWFRKKGNIWNQEMVFLTTRIVSVVVDVAMMMGNPWSRLWVIISRWVRPELFVDFGCK